MASSTEVNLERKLLDGKLVLEVIGRRIVLSEILCQIERQFEEECCEIAEVRFVASEIFYVDVNLSNKVWRGKNIAVLATVVDVSKQITWEVSGKDSDHVYDEDAGTDDFGNGKRGNDGYPGESGGNVLILANEYKNVQNFSIISNGGNGSKGQDGGNGANGKDGIGITKHEFMEKFPPTSKFAGYTKAKNVKKNETSIHEWTLKYKLSEQTNEKSHLNTYIEVGTNEGIKIIFSFSQYVLPRHSYLLFKGSPGKPGGKGGECGLGGQGGFAGEIVLKCLSIKLKLNIITFNNQGKDGLEGLGGLYGVHGKNGCDMGWIDYVNLPPPFWSDWPKYYGTDENSKLSLHYYAESSSDRVWCHHRSNIDDYCYVGMKASGNEHNKTYRERNNAKTDGERQHHARALRKSTILENSFLNTYYPYIQTNNAQQKAKDQAPAEKVQSHSAERSSMQTGVQRQDTIAAQSNIQKNGQILGTSKLSKEQLKPTKEESSQQNSTIGNRLQEENVASRTANVQPIANEKETMNIDQVERKQSRSNMSETTSISQIDDVQDPSMLTNQFSSTGQQSANAFGMHVNDKTCQEESKNIVQEHLKAALAEPTNNNSKKDNQLQKENVMSVETEFHEETVSADHIQGDAFHNSVINIKRQVSYFNEIKNQSHGEAIELCAADKDTEKGLLTSAEGLWMNIDFDNVQAIANRLRDNIQTTRKALKILVPQFENISQCEQVTIQSKDQLFQCQSLLINKYRIAAFEEIGRTLYFARQSYENASINIEFTAKEATRYLIASQRDASGDDCNISCPAWGRLHPYLYENSLEARSNVAKNWRDKLKPDREMLKCLLKTFVLETGKWKEHTFDAVKKYYEEYVQQSMHHQEALKVFERRLAQPEHAEIFVLWNSRDENQSASNRSAMYNKLKKYKSLKADYDNLTRLSACISSWDSKCCEDWEVLKLFEDYIKQFNSKTYRELLAYCFELNIRVYERSADGDELVLLENHNAACSQAHYTLQCKSGKFEQLKVNHDLFLLDRERQQMDLRYGWILSRMECLKSSEEIDEFLEGDGFLDVHPSSAEMPVMGENDDANSILLAFPEKERRELSARLPKLTSEYIGQKGILYYLRQRFAIEGRHICFETMCFLVNVVISYCAGDTSEQYTFAWLIAAYPQRRWLDEVVLLLLENYFQKRLETKVKWREYLSRIECKKVLMLLTTKLTQQNEVSIEHLETIFYLLSSTPSGTVYLEQLELSEWPYFLKEKYWHSKLSQLTNLAEGEQELSALCYYVLSIQNMYGEAFLAMLMNSLLKKKKKSQALCIDSVTCVLVNIHSLKWNLSTADLVMLENCSLDEWKARMDGKHAPTLEERTISQLVEIIENSTNSTKNLRMQLPDIEKTIVRIRDGKHLIGDRAVRSFSKQDIQTWAQQFVASYKEGDENEKAANDRLEVMLAVIDRAIEVSRGFRLRDTQKLAVLALVANKRSTLAQVSTGEGKSLIVVAVALMKALLGQKVDVVTSSLVLAKRDAESNKDLYHMFNVTVAHNCNEAVNERKTAYSTGQVVYGDMASFQRDHLLDRFYGKNILGERDFANVIVDEVDSMLLDKGNNMLYLSHDIAGMDKLESVYLYIWNWINQPVASIEDIAWAFNIEAIHHAITYDLFGIITPEDIVKIDEQLSERDCLCLWSQLVEANILDGQGKLLIASIDEKATRLQNLQPAFVKYKERIFSLLQETIERKRSIFIPNYLLSFVERHLNAWISSAISAFLMIPGQSYVVDVDRTGTSSDRNPNIIILDKDTGTDLANSQWDQALHQFLQLKHGCKLSVQSLKAVFISNVSYFKLYRQLYGLTGTLGSQRERELLQKIHNVDYVTIPTARSKLFHEELPVLCCGRTAWINSIREKAKLVADREKRSVLVICDSVKDAEDLLAAFREETGASNVHLYVRDYEEFEVTQGNKSLEQGKIIIATNLAGRGTDIKLSRGLQDAGGLHVCLTYLPNNVRIEEQAFGRAARCGDKGSGQLIIVHEKGQGYGKAKVIALKKERDEKELFRVAEIKSYYDSRITAEESSFKAFKKRYEQMKHGLCSKCVPQEIQDILLQSCLDRWAFWLDKHDAGEDSIQGLSQHQKLELISSLDQLITDFEELDAGGKYASESWLSWVKGNPPQMVKLGVCILRLQYTGHSYKSLAFWTDYDADSLWKISFNMFEEVIKVEPQFSEAAHYYIAYALAKKIDWKQKPAEGSNKSMIRRFKKELRAAAASFKKHKIDAICASGLIENIKEEGSKRVMQSSGYAEQKKQVISLYDNFIQSIDDILGHAVTQESFVNHEINASLSEGLFKHFIQTGVLCRAKIKKKRISQQTLKPICNAHGISTQKLLTFLMEYPTEIVEKDFEEALERAIRLPTREHFWAILVAQGALHEIVNYIVVDEDKIKQVDPSLWDFVTDNMDKKGLKMRTVAPKDRRKLVLYVEQLFGENQNQLGFMEEDFIQLVGQDHFSNLEENGVLTRNKMASIIPGKVDDICLPVYDSITVDDFTEHTNIVKCEAERILSDLVDLHVLYAPYHESESGNVSFTLATNFNTPMQSRLLSCAVYEQPVRNLLQLCFSYRIALQHLSKQLSESSEDSLLHLKLSSRPHTNVIFQLVEANIIKPASVAKCEDDIEKLAGLQNLQNKPTKSELQNLLSQNERFPSNCTEEDWQRLVQCNWLSEEPIMSTVKRELVNLKLPSLGGGIYYNISEVSKRTGTPNISHKTTVSYNNDKTIEKILSNRLLVSQTNIIGLLTSNLAAKQGFLKSVKYPKANLKSLDDYYRRDSTENVEELLTFAVNGLEHLLQLEEAKWTAKMLGNVATVVTMGLAQLWIGVYIQAHSLGLMTHVGGAFINESTNDLIYAISCLKSGSFSWKNYWYHKCYESILITAGTSVVAAWISKGVKFSKLGQKLAQSGFKYGGNQLSQTSTKKIMEFAGKKVVTKHIVKRTLLKATEGIALGVSNMAVDHMVESYFQTMSNKLASEIIRNFSKQAREHRISDRLKQAYDTLGEKRAWCIVDDIINTDLNEQNLAKTYAFKIENMLSQGILEGLQKLKNADSNNKIPIRCISQVVTWSQRVWDIGEIILTVVKLLDNMDHNMEIKMKNLGQEIEQDQQDQLGAILPNLNQEQQKDPQAETIDEDYERFRHAVYEKWEKLLSNRIGGVIVQHVVRPILTKATNSLMKYAGKQVKNAYKSIRERKLRKQFNNLKMLYMADMEEYSAKKTSSRDKDKRTDEYHESLRKLMRKTRSPTLFADMIRENVPMDFTCAAACTSVAYSVLMQEGVDVSKLKIVIQGENGMEQTFCAGFEESVERSIVIKLKDGHYSTDGSAHPSESGTNGGNNCLFEALAEQLPELHSMGSEAFRNEVADTIMKDPELQNHIRNGYHALPIQLGAFGGAYRQRSEKIEDESSTTNDFCAYKIEVSIHLISRTKRFIRYIGILKKISKETGIPAKDLVVGNDSKYQDRRSDEKEFVCAHIIKDGEINPILKEKHPDLHNMLANFLGKTHKVPHWANTHRGIGGDFDKIQTKYKSLLLDESLTYEQFSKEVDGFKGEIMTKLNARAKGVKKKLYRNKYNTQELQKWQNQAKQFNQVLDFVQNVSSHNLMLCGQDSLSNSKIKRYSSKTEPYKKYSQPRPDAM